MAHNFITALAISGGALDWTILKLVKGRVEVAEHKTAELPVEAAVIGSPAFAEAIARIAPELRGEVCFGLRTDRVLMRIVELPTADPAEMAGMVELQVDKFSPFPVEHMAVSFESLGQKGTASRVCIAAAQRDIVTGIGDTFRPARRLPAWVDVDVMGWWTLLKEQGEIPAQGLSVTLMLEPEGADLLICENGMPVAIRSLGSPVGVPEDEYFAELAEEIGYSLTNLEAELGIAAGLHVTIWHRGDSTPPKVMMPGMMARGGVAALVGRIRESCGVDVGLRRLDELPPLSEGLARRAAAREGAMVNLAPPDWRTEEQSRVTRKALIVATSVFIALWALGVGIFFGGLSIERNRLATEKAAVAALEEPAAEIRVLREKIRSFEQYADRTHSALEALREVVVLLPNGVDMLSFTYRKGGSVSVRGMANAPDPIYDFFQGLEQSPFFVKVEAGDVRSKPVGNVQKSEFSVTAYLPTQDEAKP